MPQALGTKTAGDVIEWITEQFGDVANVQIDTPKIIRWINLAVLEICTRDPLAYQQKVSMSTVVGQNEYSYPTGMIHARMVKWKDRPLQPISFELVQQQTESAFTGEEGEPTYWSHFANNFQLYPVPNTVETLAVYGVFTPALLTGASDLIPLSDQFYPRILEYVQACALDLDEDYEAAAAKRTQFEDFVKIGQNSEERQRGFNPQIGDPDYEEDWF